MAVAREARAGAALTSGRSERIAFLVFLVVYPVLFYPQYLVDIVWRHQGIFFSNGEVVYYIPRIVALLLLVLLTWRSWTLEGWFPKLLVAEGAWVVFVTLLHPDPDGIWYTLFGNLDRFDGLVYQLLLVGAGLTAYGLYRRSARQGGAWPRRVEAALALAGVVPAVLVLVQAAGVDPIGWMMWGRSLHRASATLGHPGYAAYVLLVSTLLALDLAASAPRRGFWLSILVLLAVGLGVTGNRTGLIALAVAVGLFMIVRRSRSALLFGALALILALGGSLSPKWIHEYPANGETRLAGGESHLFTAETLASRAQLWRAADRLLASSPQTLLTGVGSGGFLYATQKLLPPNALEPFWSIVKGWEDDTVKSFTYVSNGPQYRDVIAEATLRGRDGAIRTESFYPGVDKAHDYFLDRTIAYGSLDALLWLVLFVGAIAMPVRRAWRRDAFEGLGFAVAAAALLVFAITWFAVVQTEPLEVVVLAAAWVTVNGPTRRRHADAPPVANGT